MAVKLIIVDGKSRLPIHSEDYRLEGEALKVLAVITPEKAHGVFKSTSFTVTGTTKIAEPKPGGALQLTDLIVSFEKKNAGVVLIQYNDGTRAAPILTSTLTDAPVNLAIAFQGNFKGWKDAWVEVVISGANSIGSVALGYLKHLEGDALPWSEWDAAR